MFTKFSTNSLATTKKRPLALTTTYSNKAFTHTAKLAGIVQGVVVQMTSSQSGEITFFPSQTLNAK